jgi:hypothetical protein
MPTRSPPPLAHRTVRGRVCAVGGMAAGFGSRLRKLTDRGGGSELPPGRQSCPAHYYHLLEHEAVYRRLNETTRAAGFPVCVTKEDIENTPEMKRLPECEAERAKAAATKS